MERRKKVCKIVSGMSLERQAEVTKFIRQNTCDVLNDPNYTVMKDNYISAYQEAKSENGNFLLSFEASRIFLRIMILSADWCATVNDLAKYAYNKDPHPFATTFEAFKELEQNSFLIRKKIKSAKEDFYFVNPCYLIENMHDDEFELFFRLYFEHE
ncbi:MAG: hypothetical protein IJJ69_00510 [Oscillospiraceae bacterium]|nr:hypothetical protein [Oscillospiraceae bacterium]